MNSIKLWVVVDFWGTPQILSVARARKESIAFMEYNDGIHLSTWTSLKRAKYRVIKVTLTEGWASREGK